MMKDGNFNDNPTSLRSESNLYFLAHSVLLERYRLLLFKQIAIFILNRLISLAIIGFVAISSHLSLVQLLAVVFVSVVVAAVWVYEGRVAHSQAQELADDLARQSGEQGLDFYIRSGYNVDRQALTRRGSALKKRSRSLALYEPQVWSILTIAFAILQYTFGSLLLH